MKKASFLIVSSYLPPEQAGSGIHAYRFCNSLLESGYSAHLLSFNRNLKFKIWPKDNNLSRVPYMNHGCLMKAFSLPLIIGYYFFFICKYNNIIIYGNQIIAYQIIILIARIFRRKIIFQSLLPGVDDLNTILLKKNTIIRKLNKLVFNNISVYFAISSLFSRIYLLHALKKPVLFNSTQGVDTDMFKPVSAQEKINLLKKLDLPVNKFIIISPGLLIKRKGIEPLFTVLAKSKLDFLLLLVGESSPEHSILPGKEKKEMYYLKKYGKSILHQKVYFTGPVENIHEYMQIADLLVLNSENEGMPNVILEGLACGIPILCRDLPGVTGNILHHKVNAYIYKDIPEINDYISFLQKNKYERDKLGKNARNFALQYLSFKKVTKNLISCLKKLN